MDNTINIVVAGIGGQGVLRASDILAEAAFREGRDVKKAEVHGMSQRGGSVTSDVRYGRMVLSPMVPEGEADFLLVLDETEIEQNRPLLATGGTLLDASLVPAGDLPHPRSLNVAMLGALATRLDISEASWENAIRAFFPGALFETNRKAFALGRHCGA